jgi:hypothetical protein
MKKLMLPFLVAALVHISVSQGQSVTAGVVGPGNYYYNFEPDASLNALPVHLGGMTYPPDSIDIHIGSDSQFILHFSSWGDGGLGGGGGDTRVISSAGEIGFIAWYDSTEVFPGNTYTYFHVPNTLNHGDLIGPEQEYQFQSPCYFWASSYGNTNLPITSEWVNIGDHYLGFTLVNSQDTIYGWVRVNVTMSNSLYTTTVRDYALNKYPSLGIERNNSRIGFSTGPNPAGDKIYIVMNPPIDDGTLTVSDINGQELIKQKTMPGETTIDISSLRSGMYFIMVKSGKEVLVRKIIKE